MKLDKDIVIIGCGAGGGTAAQFARKTDRKSSITIFEKGKYHKKERSYKKAAFYFEAALQIEKQPEVRNQMLNHLVACYLKSGRIEEARIITARLERQIQKKLYNIFPEKGF